MLLGNVQMLQDYDTAQNDDPFAMLDEGETVEPGEGETGEEPDEAEIDAVEEAEQIEDPEETEEEIEIPAEDTADIDEMSDEEVEEAVEDAEEEAAEDIDAVEEAGEEIEADVEESTERLELIHTLLCSVEDPNEIADQLTDDPSFMAMFGEDPTMWLTNVEDFLVAQDNMALCHGVIAQELGLRLLTDEDVDTLNETNPGRAVAAAAYLNMADLYTELDCEQESLKGIYQATKQRFRKGAGYVADKARSGYAQARDIATGKVGNAVGGRTKVGRGEAARMWGYLKPGKKPGTLRLTGKGVAAIAVAAGTAVAVSAAGYATYALIRGKNLGAKLSKFSAAKINEARLGVVSVTSLPSKADFTAAVKACNAALSKLDSACNKLPNVSNVEFDMVAIGVVKESGPVAGRGWTSANDLSSAVSSLIDIHGKILKTTETTVARIKSAKKDGGDKAALKAQFKAMKKSTGSVADTAGQLTNALVTLVKKVRA